MKRMVRQGNNRVRLHDHGLFIGNKIKEVLGSEFRKRMRAVTTLDYTVVSPFENKYLSDAQDQLAHARGRFFKSCRARFDLA